MPNTTFFNLSEEKQQWLLEILLDKFYDRHISQVKVSEIVEAMGMSRGAFYKYFVDLEDAYSYTVETYSNQLHGDIIISIMQHRNHFFLGIENYLARCAQLAPGHPHWQAIKLLTRANDLNTFKRMEIDKESSMIKQWLELLELNHFAMETIDEAISFLYFVMALAMTSLKDYVANQWTAEELVKDFRYKVKWLEHGTKK
ncbi:hypothetical protein A5844_000034 [Enterococcus sp. 10A9_DIV0425]|uniref:HTH tetR-type domain-containing protein n=1 Tax=Candidatus Enterococcus wittei TaxID=1987383 RepID=A0A2C9XNR5_9ENTE|nr:TetR family transcriptional regulator [Enterococcus sp. 10A9_DIV0425]OTP11820.1 hypothetical protein A5844_000034 [Enterococcus sp. 10A9_DIV0425]THE14047.1 TetR/AcrR family transcriptional regulator [Enterococcus hirae]